MSPEQIEVVRLRWSAACRDQERLVAAVAARLGAPGHTTVGRARWTVDAVTRLAEVLDRPAVFAAVAATECARRTPVTLDELAGERDALMDALQVLEGELRPSEVRAWALAFRLFEEIVAALWLDPFHCRDLTVPTPESSSARPPPTTRAGGVSRRRSGPDRTGAA